MLTPSWCRVSVAAMLSAGGLMVCAGAGEAATLWQLPVRFTEFRGAPGGFENNGTTHVGLAGSALVDKVTVWFGFNDVAFDPNGDGFTLTAGDHTARLVSLSLGSSTPNIIPEPDLATLVSLGLAFIVFRYRFRHSHRAP